jgi:hypothetical protein
MTPLPVGIGRDSRIYVAGHRGLVGSALVRRLRHDGCRHVLTAGREQVDLRDQAAVNYWFRANRPEQVFMVAGTVSGRTTSTSTSDRARRCRSVRWPPFREGIESTYRWFLEHWSRDSSRTPAPTVAEQV